MRLFRRIGDIVAANLNDLVDRFEDPEVMLKEAIREMEVMIERATAGAARAIAGERLLEKQQENHRQEAKRWQVRAHESVAHGEDDQGRRAIAHGLEHEALATAISTERSAAEQIAESLRTQIRAMKAKHAEAVRKLSSLAARRQIVANGRALQGIAAESSAPANGFGRFNRMHARIDQAEAECQARAELDAEDRLRTVDDHDAREQSLRIEAELAAIKERIHEGKQTIGTTG
jgi:phage shock protein A